MLKEANVARFSLVHCPVKAEINAIFAFHKDSTGQRLVIAEEMQHDRWLFLFTVHAQ